MNWKGNWISVIDVHNIYICMYVLYLYEEYVHVHLPLSSSAGFEVSDRQSIDLVLPIDSDRLQALSIV